MCACCAARWDGVECAGILRADNHGVVLISSMAAQRIAVGSAAPTSDEAQVYIVQPIGTLLVKRWVLPTL